MRGEVVLEDSLWAFQLPLHEKESVKFGGLDAEEAVKLEGFEATCILSAKRPENGRCRAGLTQVSAGAWLSRFLMRR